MKNINNNFFKLDGDICEIINNDIFIDISQVLAIQLSLSHYTINISNSYIEVSIKNLEDPKKEVLEFKNIWLNWKKNNRKHN